MITFHLHPIVDGRCGCGNPACTDIGKHPSEKWGKDKLPADRPELTPTANAGVGIATGERSGCFVVDLDVKDDKDGVSELSKLGEVPKTYTVATPTGGFHLYFQHPGFKVRNSGPNSNPIGPGIDIRGDGGYVVAPGSPHKNGGVYTIACEAPIAQAPSWLLGHPKLRHTNDTQPSEPVADVEKRLVDVPKAWRISKAKDWLEKQPPAIEHHGGDGFTFKLVTQAVHEWGLTDEAMVAEAFDEWNARCEPPWVGEKWSHKIDSALNHSTLKFDTDTVRTRYTVESLKPKPASEDTHPPENCIRTPGGLIVRTGGWDDVLPPPTYVLEPLLVAGSVSLFVAHGNSLKSMSSISIAISVALGRPWLQRFVTKQGPTLIVDFERNEYEIRRRIRLLKAQGLKNFMYISQPASRADEPKFWDDIETLHPSLVVIDSLAASALGVDENERGAALPLSLAAKFAHKTGCSALFIHHARKGGNGDKRETVRGSTAIFAAVDSVYQFEPLEAPDGVKRMRVACIKMNLGREPAPFAIELTDEDGLTLYEEPAAEAGRNADTSEDVQAAIRLALSDGPVAGVNTLARKVGKQTKVVSEGLKLMLEKRHVRKSGDGYELDDEDKRTGRILEFVQLHGHEARYNSDKRLAEAAEVRAADVKKLRLAHVIERAVGPDSGGFVPGSNWPEI